SPLSCLTSVMTTPGAGRPCESLTVPRIAAPSWAFRSGVANQAPRPAAIATLIIRGQNRPPVVVIDLLLAPFDGDAHRLIRQIGIRDRHLFYCGICPATV